MKIWARVQDWWLDVSFEPKWPKRSFSASSPKAKVIKILLKSYHSGENEVLFVKIRARVPELWLDTSSGPK